MKGQVSKKIWGFLGWGSELQKFGHLPLYCINLVDSLKQIFL